MKRIIKYTVLVSFIFVLQSCFNQTQVTNQSYTADYNKKEFHLHPEYLANNIQDGKTRVFLKLRTSELLYARNFEKDLMQSNLVLKYKLFSDAESALLIDTGTVVITDDYVNEGERKEEIIKTFELKTPASQNCFVEIYVTQRH